MKTIKLYLSIALVALTTTLFGKIAEPEADCSCCPVDIFMDQDLSVENWMSEPFESANFENDIALEDWMTEPFEAYFESELSLESWMIIPFESADNIEVEQWMTAAWF